jgi:hypothetical protein
MAEIDVKSTDRGDSYEFQVIVREGGGQTQHRVTLKKSDYRQLVGDQTNPDALVEESFRFLLEREPKESILRSFDLMVIGRYFPEYQQEIARRF